MTRKYSEFLAAIQEMQKAGTAVYEVEGMLFGCRLAVEKESELPGRDGKVPGRGSIRCAAKAVLSYCTLRYWDQR